MTRKSVLSAILYLCSCAGSEAQTPPATPVAEASSTASAVASAAPEVEAPPPPEPPPLPAVVFAEAEPAAPPSTMPSIAFTSPRKNAVLPAARAGDTEVKLNVKGWELSGGNHIQLILDNRPSLRVDDLKRTIKLKDVAPGYALGAGQHFLAAIPARPSAESVKPVGKKVPIAIVSFFVDKKGEVAWKEGSPLLIYSAPRSGPAPAEGVLVDFYVVNAQLAMGSYVVHAAVSGPGLRVGESLSSWKPWRLKNARPGLHAIELSLHHFVAERLESSSATSVTYVSKPLPGMWNRVGGEFTVEAK